MQLNFGPYPAIIIMLLLLLCVFGLFYIYESILRIIKKINYIFNLVKIEKWNMFQRKFFLNMYLMKSL